MKHSFLAISFIAFLFTANAQTDNKIVIGTIDSIQSKILNENRKIWVHVPNSASNDVYSKRRYPVVYLLDGDGHFSSVAGMIQQLSTVNGNMICPEMIVVGIPNTNRTRDLTPTQTEPDPPFVDSARASTSGGGKQFISFIEKELMPYIDAQYPTAPYKIFIGHSLGGLLVIHTLLHHTHLFNSYVSIDPSMWWDKQNLLNQSKKIIDENKFLGKTLYLGFANTLEEGMDMSYVVNDTSRNTAHIRSILVLQSYFQSNRQNGLKYKDKYYPDDTHGSVPLITEYDALRFIFDFYPLSLTRKDYFDSTATLADKFEKHFENVSGQMGYKINAPENQINGLGYLALRDKHFKKAKLLFKYNVDNNPESFNAYDSMGDFYEATGDKINAITNFQKALTIKENPGTRKKLEKIQGN